MRDLPFFPIGSSAGETGKDGISPTISVSDIEGGHRITIVDTLGTKTVDVLDGVKGDAGPQGIQGEPGPVGEPGPRGEKGDTGPQGPAGDKGDTGETGATGPRGETGEQGPIGPQGPQGERGLPGETGPQGIQGERGLTGETGPHGPTGPAGKDGANGVNGKSAFEYAQDGGYAGTEAEFIELLANSVDKRNIALGLHTDGLLYLFINGEPVGTGITINTTEA